MPKRRETAGRSYSNDLTLFRILERKTGTDEVGAYLSDQANRVDCRPGEEVDIGDFTEKVKELYGWTEQDIESYEHTKGASD